MIEVQLLYDPVTKRCCKKRVTNTLNQMGGEWGSFLLSIQKSFNERLTNLEQSTAAIHSHCQVPVYDQLTLCDQRMESIHRTVQDQIIQAYVPLANRTAEILEGTYQQPVAEAETPQPSPTPTFTSTTEPTYDSSSSQPFTPSKIEMPPSPKTTGKVPCLEIDLCEGLYVSLRPFLQWVNEISPLISIVLANMAGQPTSDKLDEPKPKDYAAPYGAFYEPVPDLADVDPAESGEE